MSDFFDGNEENALTVSLTGREAFWLIYLANEELKRLQDLSVAEGNPMTDAKRFRRWEPISNAFTKLHSARPNTTTEAKPCPEQ